MSPFFITYPVNIDSSSKPDHVILNAAACVSHLSVCTLTFLTHFRNRWISRKGEEEEETQQREENWLKSDCAVSHLEIRVCSSHVEKIKTLRIALLEH